MYYTGLFAFCFMLPCSQPAGRCSLVSVDGRRLRHIKQYSRHTSQRQIDICRSYHIERQTELPRECSWTARLAAQRQRFALQLLPPAYHQSYQDNTGIYLKITHEQHSLGTRWRGWVRHCATRRKNACSIPDGVTGIFH